MKSKTFKQVLARKPRQFEQLLEKVEELRLLNEILLKCLDPMLVPHCQVANYRAGCLIIMADSAAWATRLRYSFPELLSRLRFEGQLFNLVSLQCIVQKELPAIAPTSTPSLTLSPENAQLFDELASAESDPELAAVLKKLASRGSQ